MTCVITVKLFYCCMFQEYWCKLPEDGNCTKTCRRKLIVKYIIKRTVHLFVLPRVDNLLYQYYKIIICTHK